MNALLADARASFTITRGRMYIAGFSGTARLAWEFAAQLDGQVAGIFGAGAGVVVPEPDGPAPARLAFFGTAGLLDFNHDEMRRFDDRLDHWGLPHRVRRVDGGHAWPPPELAAEGIDWFDLHAMRSGLEPVDSAFIAAAFIRDSARIEALRAADELTALVPFANQVASDYAGLRDTTGVADIARRLRQERRVIEALADEDAFLAVSAVREQRLVAYLDRLRNMNQPPALADALAELHVNELIVDAAGPEPRVAFAARRMLEQVFAATSFYAPREHIERGTPGHALVLLDVADTIHPGRAQVLLQRARALSALGRPDQAQTTLERAIQAGIPIEVARADPLLARLIRRDP
jgi:hypothetical protein